MIPTQWAKYILGKHHSVWFITVEVFFSVDSSLFEKIVCFRIWVLVFSNNLEISHQLLIETCLLKLVSPFSTSQQFF